MQTVSDARQRIAGIGQRRRLEPALLKGGETVMSLSTAFLADLEEDWRQHGKEFFPVLRQKYPQAYFQIACSRQKRSWISWKSASVRKGTSCSSSSSAR